jgi:hypothetical protein
MSKPITDAELLELIEAGVLYITDLESDHPGLYVAGRLVKSHLNEQGGRRRIHGSDRYRWTLRYDGRRRSIMRSKLVWMYVHRRPVPDNHIIHHGSRGRYVDCPSNLSCIHYDEHNAIHYGPQ